MSPETRIPTSGDRALLNNVAAGVLDHCVDPDLAAEFLHDPRHPLAVAIHHGQVVGFASGVHAIHPGQAPGMWVNEVGVAPSHQGRGLGRAIVQALLQHARQLGCREAWVLTDQSNGAAMRLYAAAGGDKVPGNHVMFTFVLYRENRDQMTG